MVIQRITPKQNSVIDDRFIFLKHLCLLRLVHAVERLVIVAFFYCCPGWETTGMSGSVDCFSQFPGLVTGRSPTQLTLLCRALKDIL